ncbi:MAG: sialate O-acetylesterase [Verrucomicrobiota bacterium]
MRISCFFVIGMSAVAASVSAAERTVLIVAGQSNVLNWHADAAKLPASEADREIAFYFHTGAPPSKAGAMMTPFNATSGGAWVTLRAQRQEPYVRYAREFFGPEISLARALQRAGTPRLAIVKVGYFGSTLAEDWRPDATKGNRLYALMCEQVATALQALRASGDTPRVAGFFWMQGETDGAKEEHAAGYEQALRAFIARVRKDFGGDGARGSGVSAVGAPLLPVILGRVGPPPARGYAYQERVRQAQVRVAEAGERILWVDTDDQPRDTDGVHMLAEGVITLGERWAEAWLKLK